MLVGPGCRVRRSAGSLEKLSGGWLASVTSARRAAARFGAVTSSSPGVVGIAFALNVVQARGDAEGTRVLHDRDRRVARLGPGRACGVPAGTASMTRLTAIALVVAAVFWVRQIGPAARTSRPRPPWRSASRWWSRW